MAKRLLALVLCGVLAAAMAGCRQQLQWAPGGGSQEQEEVWLEITDVDMESGILSVTWHNETLYEAIYGAPYVIERQENGQWVSCATSDEVSFIAIAYVLKAEGSNSETYSLKAPYRADQPGLYRIRSECYLQSGKEGSEKRELTAEFTLEKATVPQTGDLAFSAQYIRTDGYHGEEQYPQTFLIDSVEALNAYYEANKDKHDLERREKVYSDTSIGFLDACDSYTEDFFKENCLVMVLVQEGSGSIRHAVTKVCRTAEGQTEVYVKSIVPEAGTCDMALWHILVELDRSAMPAEDQIRVCWDDGNTSPHGNIQKEVPGLTLLTPDGSVELHSGTSSWRYTKEDGTFAGIESCGMHPLQSREYLETVRISGEGEVKLAFTLEPDYVEVICWSDEHWGDPDAAAEKLAWEDGLLRLKPGGYVYQIYAQWQEAGLLYGGSAYYSLYAIFE